MTGVLDELYGREHIPLPRLPADVSLHDPARARAAMRLILEAYPDHERVTDGSLEPADVVVVGPPGRHGPSPGHVLLAGFEPNTLWHAVAPGVCFTGVTFDSTVTQLVAVYRLLDRERWLRD